MAQKIDCTAFYAGFVATLSRHVQGTGGPTTSQLTFMVAAVEDSDAYSPASSVCLYGDSTIKQLRDFLNTHYPPTQEI